MESKTALEVPFLLRRGCEKVLNQGQILTTIAGIIRFYHLQTEKVFLRYFDGLDHNYGLRYLFSRAKFFGKFLSIIGKHAQLTLQRHGSVKICRMGVPKFCKFSYFDG